MLTQITCIYFIIASRRSALK